MPSRVVLALCIAALLAPARAASAAPWSVSVEAGTEFPVAVGASAHAEGPGRVRLSTSVGLLPAAYVRAIDAFLVGIDAYDQATADLVESSLASSLVFRAHLGWRPFAARGFYVEAGYRLVALGGSTSGAELITAVTGQAPPASDASSSHRYDVASTLHMADVELGWEWRVAGRWRLRAAVGAAFTVAARTHIEPEYTPRSPQATARFTSAGEAYLDDTYTSYVFTPVLSLAAGFVFGR